MTKNPDGGAGAPTNVSSAPADDAQTLTAKQAAALVKRAVPQPADEAGNPVADELVRVREDEVLAHKLYEDGRVVVVTVDGQKFEGKVKG